MSLYDRAKAALEVAGLKAYRTGEKIGVCKSAFLVLYDGGVIPASRVTGYRVIGVAAFVPLNKREELDPLLRAVDTALATLKLRPRGSPAAEGINEEFKAHTLSIEYIAPCAL